MEKANSSGLMDVFMKVISFKIIWKAKVILEGGLKSLIENRNIFMARWKKI